MSFEEAVAQQPQWVQIWVNVIGFVLIGSFVVLLFSKATRRDALILLAVNVAVVGFVMWQYSQMGYTRLLGLGHILFWTPLVWYFWRRLKHPEIGTPFRQVMWLLIATLVVSLAFDYADAVRYLLGDRAPMAGTA